MVKTAEICIRPWKYFVEPFRIAGNLYYVGNSDVSCHLIATEEGLILLDTAFPQTVYLLLEAIRRLGFDPADIRYILHIHGHYDHFGGTKAIRELTGAATFLGERDVPILTERPELSWAPEYGVEFYESFEVTNPLNDGDRVRLGGTSIECLHTPGHTDGVISYFFEIEHEGKRCRAGIHGGPGLNTLSGEYLAKNALPNSRRSDYMASLARLKERKVDIHLGAHPSQNSTLKKHEDQTEGSNPFLDGHAWPRFLDGLERQAKEMFERDPV